MQSQIDKTAAAVRRWRSSHPNHSKELPTNLQRKVVRLLETCSWDDVCEAIGITRGRLATWRRLHREHLQLKRRSLTKRRSKPEPPEETEDQGDFIELPLLGPATSALTRDIIAVELELPSGVVLRARTETDASAVVDLITRVLGEASGHP